MFLCLFGWLVGWLVVVVVVAAGVVVVVVIVVVVVVAVVVVVVLARLVILEGEFDFFSKPERLQSSTLIAFP